MKKPTQITPEQKKDLKALSRMPTEANKRRHRSGGTAQPGRRARYRPCAAQAPPSRRTKISTTQRFFNRRAAEDCGPYHWVGWAPPSCRRGGFRQDVQDWRDASRASRPSRLSRGLPLSAFSARGGFSFLRRDFAVQRICKFSHLRAIEQYAIMETVK